MNKKFKQILSAILAGTFIAGLIITSAQIAKAQEPDEVINNDYINETLTEDFHNQNNENSDNVIQSNDETDSSTNENTNNEILNEITDSETQPNVDETPVQDENSDMSQNEVISEESNIGENSDEYEVPTATDSFRYQNGHNITNQEVETDSPFVSFYAIDNSKAYNPVTPDGRRPTANAIDVSRWQGTIDWNKVKASGDVDFAILRIASGWDIHEQGDKWVVSTSSGDAKFKEYAKQCEKLGIPIGGYFFSYADSVEDAKKEALLAIEMLKDVKIDYPIYYDLEDNATTGTQSPQTIAQMAKVFNDTLSSAGYQVGVYASKSWFENQLSDPYFDTQRQWVAQYYNQCTYKGNYEMWQYSSTGTVNGIKGSVDMNYWYGDSPTSSTKVTAYVDSKEETITVTATNVKNAKSVSFPVWTSSNGQDDLIWHKAKQIGLNTWSAVIPISSHKNEKGQYNIHAYVTDSYGNETFKSSTSCFLSDIICSEITATTTKDTDASVNVNIKGLVSNHSITKVTAAVWSDVNGKDDLIWYSPKKQSNGNYTFNFKPIDHKLSTGKYFIEVYATDSSGLNKMVGSINYNMPNSVKPTINAVSNYTTKSIDITVTSDANLNSVSVPVWSHNNGQDDIKWYATKKQSGNKWTVSVPISNHKNDKGYYSVHCYYKYNGVDTPIANTTVLYQDYSDVKVTTKTTNSETGEFKVTISNISNSEYISSISVPVWSDNGGQDDIVWYNPTKENSTTYSLTIKPNNHKGDSGIYYVDTYFNLTNGTSIAVNKTKHNVIINSNPTIVAKPNTANDAINITISNLKNAQSVSVPVWTENNGQDDLKWYPADKQNSTTWTLTVPIINHKNELGKYVIHVYYVNSSGKQIFAGSTTSELEKIKISSISTTTLNQDSGLFKVSIKGVTSPSPIKSISVPVWSNDNGQDDIRWYSAIYDGNNSYSLIVDPSNHKNSLGYYSIHVYGTDGRNVQMFLGSTSHNVKKVSGPSISVSPDVNHEYILVRASGLQDAKSVSFPIWTESNGQDDLKWYAATQQSDKSWTAKIPISNHKNQTGKYYVDAYYTNTSNEFKKFDSSSVTIQGITAKSISANLINNNQFKVIIYGVSSPAGIKQVQFPVWSEKNGQDDIIWYTAKNEGNGTYSFTVDISKHKNDSGKYYIHAYASDNRNISSLVANTTIDITKTYTKNFGLISKVE